MPVSPLLHGRQRTEHDVVGLAWQLVLDGALLGAPQHDALKEHPDLLLPLRALPQNTQQTCSGLL